MPIVKRTKQTVFADNEMIKLKRQARLYKVVLMRILNIAVSVAMILAVYYYRHSIASILEETKDSYSVLYRQISKISSIFGHWCNKGIDSVEITGLKYVDKQEIVSAMYRFDSADNLEMRSSVSDIHGQILSIPIVRSATIRRVLWHNKMLIDIKEKQIIATVKDKLTDKVFLLDDSGAVLKYPVGSKFDSLPIVEDSIHPEKLIPIYKYLKENNIYDKVYGFSMVSERRWNIRFKNNLLVKLPAKEWQDSIDILKHIDERMNLFSKDNTMVYIDLRIPGKIFLK